MKLLSEILYKCRIDEVKGNTNLAIDALTFDSRKVEPFGAFIAVKGVHVDGHEYIDTAIEKGAIAIVCQEFPAEIKSNITYVQVKDSAEALGIMASNFYNNPSDKLKLIGITGTNGKTTTVTLLLELFKSLGHKVGLISTVKNQIVNEVIPSTHTTPDPIQLNALLATMVAKGVSHCFMEVSSHAIHQKRIAGLSYDVAGFTNITHDHLDYHKTFDEYILAKKAFFDGLSSDAIAVVNADDKHGETMVLHTKAKVKKFGMKSMADYKCKILENQFTGLLISINNTEVWSKLIGSFNASNLLLVYAIALELEQDQLQVLTSISTLGSVEGRFQHQISNNQVTGIVDYAHTPDALENVLKTIDDIRTRNEQVITIVGCGGDRDKTKRPLMAAIACKFSDKVILTSDNPRTENPDQIIEDMKKGLDITLLKKSISITDRREAIKTACMLAEEGDIILIAGKGHEKYQDINGVKHDFDDKIILTESFKMLEK